MDLGLKGKGAIVTGASRGIGQAVASALAAEGLNLSICSRNEEEIQRTAKDLSSRFSVRVYAESCDLVLPGAAEKFIEGSGIALGQIDILVNNVGAGLTRPFEDLTEKDWEETFEKNFWSAFRCSQAVLKKMKNVGYGKIINIAALSGKVPRKGQIGSNVPKAALINLTESLACEYGPIGIRVNAVCPALILTERWQQRIQKLAANRGLDYETAKKELAKNKIPTGSLGTPEDVASLVAFLSSPKSDFINGVAIEVDGGLGRCISLEY